MASTPSGRSRRTWLEGASRSEWHSMRNDETTRNDGQAQPSKASNKMNYLLLIRHSLPVIDPDLPASQWDLSTLGCTRAESLAKRLGAYAPDHVVTSHERKAIQTGEIIASHFGREALTHPGLHEQV